MKTSSFPTRYILPIAIGLISSMKFWSSLEDASPLVYFLRVWGEKTGGLTWSAGLVLSTSQPVYQKTQFCVAPKVKINSWGLPIVFCLWENYVHDRVFLLRDSDLAQRQTHTFQAKKYRMLKKCFINLIGRISFHLLFAPYILCLILWLIRVITEKMVVAELVQSFHYSSHKNLPLARLLSQPNLITNLTPLLI